eukprot:1395327-Amorphochlora_amoeboformis.AAC.1
MVLTRSARRSISSNTLLESQEFKAGISDKENFSPDVVKKTAPSSARKSSGRRKALQMKTLNRSKSVRSLGMTPEPKKLRRKASARKVPASASKTCVKYLSIHMLVCSHTDSMQLAPNVHTVR